MIEVLHAAHGPKYTHDRYEKYFLTYDNFLILKNFDDRNLYLAHRKPWNDIVINKNEKTRS